MKKSMQKDKKRGWEKCREKSYKVSRRRVSCLQACVVWEYSIDTKGVRRARLNSEDIHAGRCQIRSHSGKVENL